MAGVIGEVSGQISGAISGQTPRPAVGDRSQGEDSGLKSAVSVNPQSVASGGAKPDVMPVDRADQSAVRALENLGSPVTAALIDKLRQFASMPGFDIEKAALLAGSGAGSASGDTELLASILGGNFDLYGEIDAIYKALAQNGAGSERLTRDLAALSVLYGAMSLNEARSSFIGEAGAVAFASALLEAWLGSGTGGAASGGVNGGAVDINALLDSYMAKMAGLTKTQTQASARSGIASQAGQAGLTEQMGQTGQAVSTGQAGSTGRAGQSAITGQAEPGAAAVGAQTLPSATASPTAARSQVVSGGGVAQTAERADTSASVASAAPAGARAEAPRAAPPGAASAAAPSATLLAAPAAAAAAAAPAASSASAAVAAAASNPSGAAGFEAEASRLFFAIANAVADALVGAEDGVGSIFDGGASAQSAANAKSAAETLASESEALARLGSLNPEKAARALSTRFFSDFFSFGASGERNGDCSEAGALYGGRAASAHASERSAAATAADALNSVYAGMLVRLKHIKTNAEALAPSKEREELLGRIKRVEEGVRFINELNDRHQYAQIPISPSGSGVPMELFVMGRGSGRKKIDPEDATLYIALATHRLGRVEALVRMGRKKSVSVCVRAGDDGALSELLGERTLLHKKLDDAGFRLSRATYKHAGEKLSPATVAKEARAEFGQKTSSTNIVDIRT